MYGRLGNLIIIMGVGQGMGESDYVSLVSLSAGATLKSDPVEVEGGILLPYNLPPDRWARTHPLYMYIYMF